MAGAPFDYDAALRAGPKYCVACGREVEVTSDGYANHKCRDGIERAKRSANSRAQDGYSRTPPLWERLADGFRMLDGDDHGR